jgi:hypothetical protein
MRPSSSGHSHRHPAYVVLRLAQLRVFRLWLVDLVLKQIERDLDALEYSTLLSLLEPCDVVSYPSPPAERLEEVLRIDAPGLRKAVRDPDDFHIAACVWDGRPDFFISSNDNDFRGSRVTPLMRGTSVVTPKGFLRMVSKRLDGVLDAVPEP